MDSKRRTPKTPSESNRPQSTPEILRLTKLIEHWAEHNDEHRRRFEESAEEAERMGLEAAADCLRAAATGAAEVSEQLRKALENLD